MLEIEIQQHFGMVKYEDTMTDVAQIVECFLQPQSMLLFLFYERNLSLLDTRQQSFIMERVKCINSEWVLPWHESIVHRNNDGTLPTLLWFAVSNIEEIMTAVEIDFLFRCVVLEKGKDFSEHCNVIFNDEYYASNEEEYDYVLGFSNIASFFWEDRLRLEERFRVVLKSSD